MWRDGGRSKAMRSLALAALFALFLIPAARAQNVNLNCQTGTSSNGNLTWAPASAATPCPVSIAGGTAPIGSITPLGVTGTPTALATSGTPNTFTTALAASSSRKGCTIQYTGTHLLYLYIGSGTASTAASEQLQPGQTFSCSPLGATIVEQGLISMASTAASDTAVVVAQ